MEREEEEDGDLPNIIAHKCRAESPYDVNIVDVAKTPPEERTDRIDEHKRWIVNVRWLTDVAP